MNSFEIENIEKLLQELDASSNLLLIDEGPSPKQFKLHQNFETKPKKPQVVPVLTSYEFLTSVDLMDFAKLVILLLNSLFYFRKMKREDHGLKETPHNSVNSQRKKSSLKLKKFFRKTCFMLKFFTKHRICI